MAAAKDKDPVVEAQEKAIKALKLDEPDEEASTAREQSVTAEDEGDEDEPGDEK